MHLDGGWGSMKEGSKLRYLAPEGVQNDGVKSEAVLETSFTLIKTEERHGLYSRAPHSSAAFPGIDDR